MVPATMVMPRDGSLALALLGSLRRVHEPILDRVASKRKVDMVPCFLLVLIMAILPTVGSGYLSHPKFAQDAVHYIRAFTILQKDLQELFDYIEPADNNRETYSYRTHALLLRACIEVEANCKAILKENGYIKQKKGKDIDMNMDDYEKINISHHLSSYQIMVPYWNGVNNLRSPFSSWSTRSSPDWYKAYNATKH